MHLHLRKEIIKETRSEKVCNCKFLIKNHLDGWRAGAFYPQTDLDDLSDADPSLSSPGHAPVPPC